LINLNYSYVNNISKIIDANYIPVKLNYSPENRNNAVNAFLGNPAKFGFPEFRIINGKGNVIHIQDNGLLEAGQGNDQKKVIGFYRN
jgi:hypothetical protein